MSSSMDSAFPSDQLLIPHNLSHNSSDSEEDYSALQSPAEYYQGTGTEASSIAPGSYPYPFNQYVPWNESGYLSNQQSVPSTPNDVSQFYPQQSFPPNDPSHTHDQVLNPFFEGHLIDNDTRHLARIQAHRAAGWGSTNFRTVDHLEAQGASDSDPSGSSSTTITDTSSSPGFYSQYGMQGDCTSATSSSRGQVGGTARSHAVTQGQNADKQEAIRRRQERKREKDRIRKDANRTADDQAYSRVCNLLSVKLDPKTTRSERILKSVETIDQGFESVCELLEISMTPKKPLAHQILDVIEGLVERQEQDNDLQRRFEESEAKVALLEIELAQCSPNEHRRSWL